MRIAHLVAGAGGMYCGSCLQGAALARAMRQLGEDATVSALYTPLRTDEADAAGTIHFGGINVALQQTAGLFARLPRWLLRQLDRPALLRLAARLGGSVDPARVGRLCVSMLQGEEGRQRVELERLVTWLAETVQPEVVHCNTVLLCGAAREIRRRLGAVVVASLGGEETFLERLPEPSRSEALSLLRNRAVEVDALCAPNRVYADFMADYLAVPRDRIAVVRPGIDASGLAPLDCPPALPRGERVIGFLGRITPDKGLHLLVEAMPALAAAGFAALRVRAAGYLAPQDRPYLASIRARADALGMGDHFEYLGEVDRTGKAAFLQSLDGLCLPAMHPEAKGLPALEGWACGVPLIAPRHGAFPELLEHADGGVLFAPGDAAALAAAAAELLADEEHARARGRRGQAAVLDHYCVSRMAAETLAIYRRLLAER